MRKGGSTATTVFVGRDAELQQLRDGLQRVTIAVVLGVPGVGKSALVSAFAAQWPAKVLRRNVMPGDTRESVLASIRRLVFGSDSPKGAEELRAALDEKRCLVLVDDVHELGKEAAELLAELGGAERARVIATSREVIRSRRGDPDRFELRLKALDRAVARELWATLDKLHGPSTSFEEAWARHHGNPLLLRGAHATATDEDPIVAVVRGLSAAERSTAGAIALSEGPLPAEVAMRIVGGKAGETALRGLVTRMVVEPSGGDCGIHELFRSAVLRELDAGDRVGLHAKLAVSLVGENLDHARKAREVCRHLFALGRHDDASEYLLRNAPELARRGAVVDLLRLLDAIPAEKRSAELQWERARTLMLLPDLRRARDELERLMESGIEPRTEIRLAFAQHALLTARLETAASVGEQLVRRSLEPSQRVRLAGILATARTYQNRGDDGRLVLSAAAAQVKRDPLQSGYCEFYRAFTYWLEERSVEAEEPMRHALSLFGEAGVATFRAHVLAPAFMTALFARIGRLEEAEVAFRTASEAIGSTDTLRIRVELEAMHAAYLLDRGERLAALASLKSVARECASGGYRLAELWSKAWLGRTLMLLGRRREALQVLHHAASAAKSENVPLVGALAARALDYDPIERARGRKPATMECPTRIRAFEAIGAAAAGDAATVEALLLANRAAEGKEGFGLERALSALARSINARAAGAVQESEARFQEALRVAGETEVDPEVLTAIRSELGAVRIVTRNGQRLGKEGDVNSDLDLVVDARIDEVRGRNKPPISLRRRPVLKRLLYLLAGSPGRILKKEIIVREVWGNEYSPLVHDPTLKVNVRRLRAILTGTGAEVEFDSGGYRLRCPSRFAFLAPLEAEA